MNSKPALLLGRRGSLHRGSSVSFDEAEEQKNLLACSDRDGLAPSVCTTSFGTPPMALTDDKRVKHLTPDDVDSRDSLSSSPIHRDLQDSEDEIRRPASLSHSNKSIWKPRGLTLSAYRRPENTIRLTSTDPNRKLETEYDLHSVGGSGVLGHGAFSTVRLAVRKSDGMRVAVKSIAKHEALRSRRLRIHGNSKYMEEWEILRRLEGQPHVIDLLDVFENNEEIQLVTEYCPGGELFDVIQKLQRRRGHKRSERLAAQVTNQILRALVDVHAQGIVHRDVKPENILLHTPTDGNSIFVKLCDFGVARPLHVDESSSCANSDGELSPLTPESRSRSFSTICTDLYAAPELTFGESYGTAVDIYSLGVTLYILLCGFPPVFASSSCAAVAVTQDDEEDLQREVLFPDGYWKDVSDGAKRLLQKMLHPDASVRVTARQALQDPWIQEAMSARSSAVAQANAFDFDLLHSKLSKSLGESQRQSPDRLSSPKATERALFLPQRSPPSRKRSLGFAASPSPRRRRMERRASTTLLALADLYRGVTAPSVIAAAAAAVDEVAAPASPANSTDSPEKFSGSPVATLSF